MRNAILYTVLIAGAGCALFPFAWMIATSLMTLQEASTAKLHVIPADLQWQNYRDAMGAAPFGRYFLNTFGVASLVAVGVVFTSVLAGYAFARLEFRGKKLLFLLVLGTMMVPFEAMLIPNYLIIIRLGWYDSYGALVVPWCANAFSVFLMRQAFGMIPREYEDAAMLDGCGPVRFLITIAAPLARPSIAIVGLFAFLGSYNALLWPLIVTSSESMRMIQVGLTFFSTDAGVRTNLLMAASVVVILPVVALYFATQKSFVEGAASTGLKG
jgi:ABC-type glycerol-3-phosphate transport system permease component